MSVSGANGATAVTTAATMATAASMATAATSALCECQQEHKDQEGTYPQFGPHLAFL